MYVAAQFDQTYRLGDIVEGYILGVTDLATPSVKPMDYDIRVTRPQYLSVMTPCCSVGGKTLSLAPLICVPHQWHDTPYLRDDFCRVNLPMLHREAAYPGRWEGMKEEERQVLLDEDSRGPTLQYLNYFVYAPHGVLGTYPQKIGNREVVTAHYAVDFQLIHRVVCEKVTRKCVPMDMKRLQLTIEARQMLRAKLVEYFGRIPDEDRD